MPDTGYPVKYLAEQFDIRPDTGYPVKYLAEQFDIRPDTGDRYQTRPDIWCIHRAILINLIHILFKKS
jgi:hypothetical protein